MPPYGLVPQHHTVLGGAEADTSPSPFSSFRSLGDDRSVAHSIGSIGGPTRVGWIRLSPIVQDSSLLVHSRARDPCLSATVVGCSLKPTKDHRLGDSYLSYYLILGRLIH